MVIEENGKMDKLEIIAEFFNRIESDPVIDPVHISLFMALCQQSNLKQSPMISIERESTMRLSKIASEKTYFRKLNDLSKGGYIHYAPSKKRGKMSKVRLESTLMK